MTRKFNAILLVLILLACVGVDQATKTIAQAALRGRPMQSFLGDTFRLQYSENVGAFLSLGAAWSPSARFWVLTVMVGIFLIGTLGYLFFNPKLTIGNGLPVALIAGGGVSNLIDRALRPSGAVIDFMNAGIGGLRTGIFNIADMAILFGVGWLFIQVWRQGKLPQSSDG